MWVVNVNRIRQGAPALFWKYNNCQILHVQGPTYLCNPTWRQSILARCSGCTIHQMSPSLSEKIKSVRSKEDYLLDQRRDPCRDQGGSCYTQTEVECVFRALKGPLNLHCIRIRAAAVRTLNTLIKYTEISGHPECTLLPNQGSCSAHS